LKLTTALIHLISIGTPFLATSATLFPAGQGNSARVGLTQHEMSRIVGEQLEEPLRVLEWKASEPPLSNAVVYSVLPPRLDDALMRRVADAFGVTGEIEQIKGETLGHIGFRIQGSRAAGTTNKAPSVYFWLTMGNFGYSSGEICFGWDEKNHKPLAGDVPTTEQAKQKALDLLLFLGLSLDHLEHDAAGAIRCAFSTDHIGFVDRSDKQRKRAILSRSVTFYQKVPSGGTTIGVGNGGQLRFTFRSDGRVSRIEWFFRRLVKDSEAKPKTSKRIIRDLKTRNAWTWHERLPPSVVVTNCVLSYPQGDSWLDQKYVAPFYLLTGTDADGRGVTLYVPLEWERKN
jgi:hypothetical protein